MEAEHQEEDDALHSDVDEEIIELLLESDSSDDESSDDGSSLESLPDSSDSSDDENDSDDIQKKDKKLTRLLERANLKEEEAKRDVKERRRRIRRANSELKKFHDECSEDMMEIKEKMEELQKMNDDEMKLLNQEEAALDEMDQKELTQTKLRELRNHLKQRTQLFMETITERKDRVRLMSDALNKKVKEGQERGKLLHLERKDLKRAKKRVAAKRSARIKAKRNVDDLPDAQTLRYSRACTICLNANPTQRVAMVACGHMICLNCAEELEETPNACIICPFCRSVTTYVKTFEDLEIPEVETNKSQLDQDRLIDQAVDEVARNGGKLLCTRKRKNHGIDEASSSKRAN